MPLVIPIINRIGNYFTLLFNLIQKAAMSGPVCGVGSRNLISRGKQHTNRLLIPLPFIQSVYKINVITKPKTTRVITEHLEFLRDVTRSNSCLHNYCSLCPPTASYCTGETSKQRNGHNSPRQNP